MAYFAIIKDRYWCVRDSSGKVLKWLGSIPEPEVIRAAVREFRITLPPAHMEQQEEVTRIAALSKSKEENVVRR